MASALCALALLRYARFPDSGRAILAGALAGFIIGPTILGRALPQHHEAMFEGGVKQREHRDYLRWLGSAIPSAMPGLTPEALAAELARNASERADAERALADARWDHQRPMRVFVMIVAALAMIASAAHRVRTGDARQGWITPISVGVWSFALPGAAALLVGLKWWGLQADQAAFLAAAVSIGPWALTVIDRRLADDAEFGGARMMQTTGRVATVLALALALWAGWRSAGWAGALMVAPLIALPASWLIPAVDLARRPLLHWLMELGVAMLAAAVAMEFDLYDHFALWPLVILVLLADDGRWLGAFVGLVLVGGRTLPRAMRLAMPAMACGSTQLAVASAALHGWLLPARFALPLLAGAILIEVTAPLRRRLAAQMAVEERDDDDSGGLV
jgi:hypothetical protein